MSGLPATLEVGEVKCLLSADAPTKYLCIPGAPKPEQAPDGRPTLGLWMIPPQPRLQLGARWWLDSDDIAAVQGELGARHPGLDVRSTQVLSAPVTVDEAVVLIDDGHGGLTELATSTTSGYPPYAAIFSAALDDAQAAVVASALNGSRGRLFVEYRGRLDQESSTVAGPAHSTSFARRVDVATWSDLADAIHVLPGQSEPAS
jgi:hypothetical protein